MKLAAVGDNCMDVYEAQGEAYPGGNPVNVAVYFVRLGGESSYTGVVGSDQYGDLMVNAIGKMGVDVSHIRKIEGKTAVTQVELINGDRVFGDYDEGVLADFRLTSEDIDFICSQDMVVSGLWGNVHDSFKVFKERGALTAFDAATRPDDPAPKVAIGYTDYFFFATDDGDTDVLREQMKRYHGLGPKLVIATMGEEGSLVFDGKEFIKYGIIKCNVIDSMGAGDSYIAGFLKGILENKEIKKCMEMGATNASKTLEYVGAW
ncbi:MAG: fructoselysine 6-kinase [Suipraeoptans sp.]